MSGSVLLICTIRMGVKCIWCLGGDVLLYIKKNIFPMIVVFLYSQPNFIKLDKIIARRRYTEVESGYI